LRTFGLGGKQKVINIDVSNGKRKGPNGSRIKGCGRGRPAGQGHGARGGRGIRSRRGVRNQLQWMNPRRGAASRGGSIHKVTSCLSESREKGGALNPAHGQGQGEGNERKPRGGVGQDDAQLGNVGGTEANTLETVRNVNFG
jgi:hypothetical protein